MNRGHIYAIELGPNVKVGRSNDPVRRIATHVRNAEAFGAQVGRQWVSGPVFDSPRVERDLIARCSEVAQPASGREMFPISWERIVSMLDEMGLRGEPAQHCDDTRTLEEGVVALILALADRDVAEVAAEAQSDFVRGAATAEKVARDRKMRTRRSAA